MNYTSTQDPKTNLIYLYDLPKEEISSTKIAMIFKEQAGVVLESRPQIRKDITKPFYSGIVNIKDPIQFQIACQKMRYFEVDGKPCRALQFDRNLLGPNKEKLMPTNVFVRNIPKDMKHPQLEQRFTNFGAVKSLKVSLNPDHTSRGYGFIQFENEDSAKTAVTSLANEKILQAFVFKPRDKRELRRLVNNIYVKNLPKVMSQEQVSELFSQYGNIKSLVMMQNDIGQFGFICYDDPKGTSKEYGPNCARKAIEGLNNTDMEELKLYVRPALKKADRELEKKRQILRYKNSKKRCNLYVKNFPNHWTQDQLGQLFTKYGEIESIRLDKSQNGTNYAFVCFKNPDEASEAKHQLLGTMFDGRCLIINHYEIKEYRQVQIEEAIDKADFEKYRAAEFGDNSEFKWSDLQASPNLVTIVSQLLNIIQSQDEPRGQRNYARQNRRGPQRQYEERTRGERNYYQQKTPGMVPQSQQKNHPNYHHGQQNHGHPQNQGQQQQKQHSKQAHHNQNYEAICPPMPGMTPAQPNFANPNQMSHSNRYLFQTTKIMGSITERNPFIKEQVGNLIFDYVCLIIGPEKAPKITGMLIELPVAQMKQYLTSFDALQLRVREADALLIETKKKEQEKQGGQLHQQQQQPHPQQQLQQKMSNEKPENPPKAKQNHKK